MQKEIISAVNRLYSMEKAAKNTFETIVKDIKAETDRLLEKCDHTWPDGKSAITSGMFCNSCDICHWNDL